MSRLPDWLEAEDGPPAVTVDWAALPEGWQRTNWTTSRADETPGEYANRVRASVSEGRAPAEALGFADWLEGGVTD